MPWKDCSTHLQLNKTYGLLTIRKIWSKKESNDQRMYCYCECQCGGNKTTRLDNVTSERIKGCGCLSKRRGSMDGTKNPAWKGYDNIPSSWLWRFRDGAKRRNIKWDLTIEEVNKLFCIQNGLCALSGRLLKFGRIRYHLETNASIDRIDSNGPYTIDNIQLVHKNINIMKQTMTQEEFISVCKEVAKYKE